MVPMCPKRCAHGRGSRKRQLHTRTGHPANPNECPFYVDGDDINIKVNIYKRTTVR